MRKVLCGILFCVSVMFVCNAAAIGQGTEFTYQGRLLNGAMPANGNYDFEFNLYPDAAGGTASLGTINLFGVPVSGGVFTVRLAFGGSFNGEPRFLEIKVAVAGSGQYATLSPRQQVLSTPYAIKSLTAAFADNAQNAATLDGVSAGSYVLTTDPRMVNPRTPLSGSPDYIQNTSVTQSVSNFNISGTGAAGEFTAANQYNIGSTRVLSIAGARNIFVGTFTGQFNTTGRDNVFVGDSAGGGNSTGQGNSFVGSTAGANNSTGLFNSFFGVSSGQNNSTASSNSFFGGLSGQHNTTGELNVFVGSASGANNIDGGGNAFLGGSSGSQNGSGSDNTFVGGFAGSGNTSGSSNTAIGSRANLSVNNLTNATAVGAGAVVSRSGAVVIGRNVDFVGIGTSTPNARLHVSNGNIYVAGSTRGVILAAPNGSCWLINVGNTGALTTSLTTCP